MITKGYESFKWSNILLICKNVIEKLKFIEVNKKKLTRSLALLIYSIVGIKVKEEIPLNILKNSVLSATGSESIVLKAICSLENIEGLK